ncbi:MAG: Zn-dependent exopeptidase M28 [Kiritimatiellae bacterium]|nr:Zn-dependent exopeptidase M28 [Kiritimatiellia bacterium]
MLASMLMLSASLLFTEGDADFAYGCAGEMVKRHTPRDAGTLRGRLACNWLMDTIASQGADVRRERFRVDTPKGEREMANLSCSFRTNPEDGWVVLLSHYDTKPGTGCPGANDGASTSALMVALARMIVERGLPRGNLMMIWTDGEECMNSYGPNDGLWGSRHAAEMLKRKGIKVRAVICLDMLGDKDLKITIPRNGDATLARIACHSARRMKLGDGFIEMVREEVKDDHVAFRDQGWRAIDLIDFSYDHWHTEEDTMDKISVESLHKSGMLVAEILNIIL